MKNKLIALFFVATAATSQGALYTFTNGSGATAAGVETSEGRVFRSGTTAGTVFGTGVQNIQTSAGPGVIAFGFFSTDELSTVATSTELVTLFTAYGATNTFGGASTGGNRSVYNIALNQTIGSTYNNKSIYMFAGNGTTLSGSTEFLVVKMDSTLFLATDDVANATTPKTITLNPGNSTTLIGSEVTNVFTTNTDSSQTAGWRMAALAPVPEPSAALLGMLGALGLLRRRR